MKKNWVLFLFSCLVLFGCQNDYASFPTSDTITERNLGKVENLNRFQTFLKNFNKEQPDHILILTYTTEGDPIYLDLQYDGKAIHFTRDMTEDEYGSFEVTETVCTELRKEESDKRVDYLLGDCEDQSQDTILVVIEH
ncbi:DUF4362 domain-containing protein [Planococcus shixiaomingii]|uniref:DUF4362 domain-containing protein n=1 Tax=Planococcus shixiaomingii TaxID=3058393 RepID=UPI002638E78C|nr:DUF4362 domain-containing protein [Planococcus sp. N022]WKA56524.1 DUF4362 domain-containing protein [Planococcus sp. N022]